MSERHLTIVRSHEKRPTNSGLLCNQKVTQSVNHSFGARATDLGWLVACLVAIVVGFTYAFRSIPAWSHAAVVELWQCFAAK